MSVDIASTLSHIESSLSSLCKDVDSLKEDRECDLGAKSPRGCPLTCPQIHMWMTKSPPELSWVERMELESGDCIHPVKVRESIETIL